MNTSTLAVRRSIVVDAPQDRCFETFVNMTSWWPLATHTIGEAPARDCIVQARTGGRWYGVNKNGDEHEIGNVLAYEPPARLLLSWEVNCSWLHDEAAASEIEVRFIPESATRTRIELEHRNLEVYGADAETAKERYEADGAWTYVLAAYAKAHGIAAGFAANAFFTTSPAHRVSGTSTSSTTPRVNGSSAPRYGNRAPHSKRQCPRCARWHRSARANGVRSPMKSCSEKPWPAGVSSRQSKRRSCPTRSPGVQAV